MLGHVVALAATSTLWTRRRPSAAGAMLLAGAGFALGEAIELLAASERDASTWLAAAVDVAIAVLLLALAVRAHAPAGARRRPVERTLHRVGWLGSGTTFFWIVLLSIRTLVP